MYSVYVYVVWMMDRSVVSVNCVRFLYGDCVYVFLCVLFLSIECGFVVCLCVL